MNACLNALKICTISALIGFLAAVFSLTETGLVLEEEWGLAWLFRLRGPLEPPSQVTIVSIDKISADILRLPEDPEKWPRTYYAELINKIDRQNPAIIAFNLFFGDERLPQEDGKLAEAMRDNGNVVLSNYLRQFVSPYGNFSDNFRYEHIIDPIPVFSREALAIAPFPLPKNASTVKRFWVFRENAGDIPTFPTTVFLCYLLNQAYPDLYPILQQFDPDVVSGLPAKFDQRTQAYQLLELFQRLHLQLHEPTALSEFRRLVAQSPAAPLKKRLLSSWADLAAGTDSLLINHYGKAGSIVTVPFYQALVSDILNPEMFDNKIVLIGYSEDVQPEKSRGFYNVFSESNGETVSPIEIAAAAVANLIANNWIRSLPVWGQFFLILGWSFMLSVICRQTPYKSAVASITGLTASYVALAYYLFIDLNLWLPVFFPVAVLTPIFLMLATMRHYEKRKTEHRKIYQTFSLFVPDDVVNSLVRQPDNQEMGGYGQLVDGVCMATDAGQYTTLSESMEPQQLKELMNRYYATIFPRVKEEQGFISDVIGDAMLALWISGQSDALAKYNACRAALQVRDAIDRFNASQPQQLLTRIGLHFGRVHLGTVGAADHYEYRAVGDVVNTATRIEGLNKLLGTRILVSAEVAEDVPEFFTRRIGRFVLKGKTQAVEIHELVARTEEVEPRWRRLDAAFAEALDRFRNKQWPEALQHFLRLSEQFPGDGPTLFYIRYLQTHFKSSRQHETEESPVIEVGNINTLLH